MCKACQSIGTMKRSSKSFPVTLTDVGAMLAGLVANFTLNGVAVKATESLDPNTAAMVNQYLPYGKAALGVAPILYTKYGRKLPRMVKAAGVGMSIGAGLEILSSVAPDMVKMAGVGDLYGGMGATDTLYIQPSGSLVEMSGAPAIYSSETPAVYGTGDLAPMTL